MGFDSSVTAALEILMKRNVPHLLFVLACAILIPYASAQSVPDKFALTPLLPDKILKPGLQILLTPDKWGAQISPDGKKLVITRAFSGTNEVWVCNVDGSSLLKLTSLAGPEAGTARWSPDGKWIAFDVDYTVRGRIFVVPVSGGPAHEVAPENDSQHLVPNWSRDGKWIYFASDRSGDWQVWQAPLEGGEPVQVTNQGGFAASESPDGAYVYYSKHRYPNPEVWRVPVGGGSEELVSPLIHPMTWADWSVTAEGVYFIGPDSDAKPTLQYFDFAARNNQIIAQLANPSFSLSLSNDVHLAVCASQSWMH